ncbi:MAG: hypothetical protein ACP5I8_14445 [Phycisphaerae bacterium]
MAGRIGRRPTPPGRYRPLAAAYRLYQDQSVATQRLESLFLTGESDITIAAVLHMSRHTIRAYRKMFFDIDAVPPKLLAAQYVPLFGALDQFARWKYAAKSGGLDVLLELWKHEVKENGDDKSENDHSRVSSGFNMR